MADYTIRLTAADIPLAAPAMDPAQRRAPRRTSRLSKSDIRLALHNALRYIPEEFHAELAPEFLDELLTRGRIYGYRFRPEGRLYGKPIDEYPGKCIEGRAFQVMIDNNLDFATALYPYELVTYGETGQVCQNWMQYNLIRKYLAELTDETTLVVESGHPLGLFKSHNLAPRVIITNGVLVGFADDLESYKRLAALGVSNYGQMTAGGWMYIGPQGIVHGTYNTVLNASRKLVPGASDMSGLLFVSSGLGGMSGAQGKAGKIAGGVALVAEVDPSRVKTRYEQGWVDVVTYTPEEAFQVASQHKQNRTATAIAYEGNIVELLEYALEHDITIDLLSDQTSCHEVYEGGYCPIDMSFAERTRLLSEDHAAFDAAVNIGLKRHYEAIYKLSAKGTYFFDYGNSFMKAIFDAGITAIAKNGENTLDGFIWPSYVEDILGPELFDFGYGPFRWVCLSGKPSDLDRTDAAAMEIIDPERRYQDRDNWVWIRDAKENQLVVGTQARILYQDAIGRMNIALRFNELIRQGEIGPVMLGRDHHDVSGTDSPFRETSNIKDGSNLTADMAIQCYAGNAARGMSLVALHNGGGVGIGKAINGGFGLVLDGSERIDTILRMAIPWDVMSGVARRAWARNENALYAANEWNDVYHADGLYRITIPYLAEEDTLDKAMEQKEEGVAALLEQIKRL